MPAPSIEFVNHACVIIETGDARILCDPWLSGRAFDDGWELVVQPGTSIADLDFTHIWISHEHPDHFSPRDLRALPAERIARTPLLYQRTQDRKVLRYCESIGYPVIEIAPGVPFALTPMTALTSETVSGYDAWLLVRTAGGVVLNLNDCRVWEDAELASIRERSGPIDVLMTQFGYANWVGNRGDAAAARHAADTMLGKFRRQIEVLAPTAVIPFASFIRYCHAENAFWNEHALKLDAALAVCADVGTQAVAMFPGDRWEPGSPPPDAAGERWHGAYEAAMARPMVEAGQVGADALQVAFADMQERVRAANDWEAILRLSRDGLLPASLVHVTDLGSAYTFDLVDGLTPSTAMAAACDIRLGSQALHNVLRFNWGRGTLTINGRFQANYPTFWRFLRQTQIPYANNIGWRFPDDLTPQKLVAGNSFLHELLAEIAD